jgi:SNF2 family DNA or RNA helicase
MSKLISECPICHKKSVTETSCYNLGKSKFITLDCGHTYREKVSVTISDEIILKDGKSLYPFQVKGVHFAEQSGFNCLIADEMGLGKTIQALGILQLHLEELKPVLVIAKASLTIQWQRHILSSLEKFAQIVNSKTDILPNLSIYITSFDTVGSIQAKLKKLNLKTIIVDECQMLKNHETKRTNAIRELVNAH